MNDNHVVAYREGWKAYYDGKDRASCPYAQFSSDYVSWGDGWYEATESDSHYPVGFGYSEDGV